MKALPTQFDDGKLSDAVATPTCCGASCCSCCCCCLASTISSSSVLAQRVGYEGDLKQLPDRNLYKVLAWIFIPISYVLFLLTQPIFVLVRDGFCGPDPYSSYVLSAANEANPICSITAYSIYWPIFTMAAVAFLVVWLLYIKVRINRSFRQAFAFVFISAIAFMAELYLALYAFIGLGTAGIILYLAFSVTIIFVVSRSYHNHLDKIYMQTNFDNVAQPANMGVQSNSSQVSTQEKVDTLLDKIRKL